MYIYKMKEELNNRIFGLDILRSIAIIIVVIAHSDFNYMEKFPFIPLPDGVDIFFVLCGYLIGTIIIKTTEQNKKFDLQIALNFIQRRWFRTLPNYFLFLLINIILVYFGLIKGILNKYLVTNFVFFQNFYKNYDFIFWESWSLSIEEWFYFMFPLTLILLFKFTKNKMKPKNIILIAIILFIIFPLAYRIIQYQTNPSLDFDLNFRKLVITRLDTIGYGLAGAYIHFYYIGFWKKNKNIFFILGLTLLIFSITIDSNSIYFLKTYYYSLIGVSIFLLLPKFESFKNETIPLKPFQFISKISYSMYLIHVPLLQITTKIFVISNKLEAILIYIFFWIVLLAVSNFVYKLYERPLMNLRDNIRVKAIVQKISSVFKNKN